MLVPPPALVSAPKSSEAMGRVMPDATSLSAMNVSTETFCWPW